MRLSELHKPDSKLSVSRFDLDLKGELIAIQLLADGELKEHSTKVPAVLICTQGSVLYEDVNGTSELLIAGDYYPIPVDVKHRLHGKEDAQLLLIK